MPKDNAARSLSITSHESYADAAVIADLVIQEGLSPASVRKSNDVQRSDSNRSNVSRRKGMKTDQINLAFDGHQTTVDMDSMDKSNGTTDIGKGVILNAQFDNHKDFMNGGNGKAMELQDAGVPKSDAKAKLDAPVSLKDMSVLRRIAFAASFLPSIMFVLCFAVILPCQKKMPCIEEIWTTTLDNTVVTYGPQVPGKVVFTFSREGKFGLQGLDSSTGITAWEEMSESAPRSLTCLHLLSNDSMACLVSDTKGNVHFYNAETGEELLSWNPTNKNVIQGGVNKTVHPSLPIILPDCNMDGVSEVVLSTSPVLLKVLFKGFSVSHDNLPTDLCDDRLDGMVPWTTENGTDIVATCKSGGKDRLLRITQENWCSTLKKNNGTGEIIILDTRPSGTFENSKILPTTDGVIVWSQEEVRMIDLNGQMLWSTNISDHSIKNRFVLHGKFDKSGYQVALFSSDLYANLQITTLNSKTGQSVWNRSMENAEISDVSLVQGSEKDFVTVVLRKVEKDLKNEAVPGANETTTSILNLISTEGTEIKSNVPGSKLTEQISFMELNGENTYKIEEKQVSLSEGEAFSTRVAVISQQEDHKYMELIVLRKPTASASDVSSQLKRINIANWDISISHGNSKCFVNEL
ncbi:hypothetical protein JTE90_028663 [Oedothorax gibbosus]|uniref:Pyrrolo-quinoline quinone repeat domain-containing protein n=1 Tax=Oedothorax gibbosus TaxID=931172 RepID=A0AAV6UY64_9ARAC|nr:hypothetical protein JTE90_028663 [Oedothorax gibbosus]